MDSDRVLWERQEGEPLNWYKRFIIFRDLGVTQRGFYQAYVEEARKSQKKPARHIPGAWKEIIDKWQWQKRVDAYDAHQLAEEEAKEKRLRQLEEEEEAKLLSTGYARKARRIEQLTILFDDLKKSYHEPEPNDERIVYPWLTPDKVREMRGCLDDIAKELGERVKKSELTGKDGGPIEFDTAWANGTVEDDSEDES